MSDERELAVEGTSAMPEHRSPDEVKQRYVDAMGAAVGTVYYLLWNDCVAVHFKWKEYVELYGTSPERVDLLNRSAASFFHLVQETLWEDILLHICRLMDPASMGKNKNLTVRRLAEMVPPALRPSIEPLIAEAERKTSFARDWRNRHIGHRDFDLATGTAKPLEPASRRLVSEALESLEAILVAVEQHYGFGSTGFGEIIPAPGHALNLLYFVREGLELRDKRRRRIRAGEHRPEDFVRKPPI